MQISVNLGNIWMNGWMWKIGKVIHTGFRPQRKSTRKEKEGT